MAGPATGLEGRAAVITERSGLGALVATVREAEDLGLEAAFIGEGAGEPDAMVRSAAALLATRRIRVGPGVVNAQERHPATLARGAAGLDRLAPGRALLGIGRGDPVHLEQTLGLPASLAGAALEDSLRILAPLLRGEGVAHRGRRWSASLEAPRGDAAAERAVPLVCAAVGERTLRLAGELAGAVMLNYGAPPEYVRWAVARVREGAERAGRDPGSVDILGIVLVARTDLPGGGEALARVQATLEFVLGIPDQAAALTAQVGGPPARVDGQAAGRLAAVGSLDQVRTRLEVYREAGLSCVVLLPSGMRALARQA